MQDIFVAQKVSSSLWKLRRRSCADRWGMLVVVVVVSGGGGGGGGGGDFVWSS